MSKSRMNIALLIVFVLASALQSFGQTIAPAGSEGKLIAVLKSDASRKEKADACRQLGVIGTKAAIAPLAALLGDEELSHMARYGLEPIPDPAVDEAFRDALGRLKGRPLVGVIGSIGVRRDPVAVPALAEMAQNPDVEAARAAARALGNIGNPAAARVLQYRLEHAAVENQLDICEGLLRCAERLSADGERDAAVAIYDKLREIDAPHQVRAGALRGAILARGGSGVRLLRQHLRSDDYILFSAAVQAAQELRGTQVTRVLTAELNELPADNQILVIQTLAKRADAEALPALFTLAKGGAKAVRLEAIRALPQIGHASAMPVLVQLLADSDGEISQTAQESLAALPGKQIDDAIMEMLQRSDTAHQLKALELIERRRPAGVTRALLEASKDDDESVRTASIRMLGDMGSDVEFDVLVDLLLSAKSTSEIRSAERALSAKCSREAKPSADKVTIRRAVYGAVGEGGSADVTEKVAKMVADGALSITASNANFGDPAQGVVKQLQIEFTADGVTQVKTVRENESVTLAVGATPEPYVDALLSAMDRASTAQKVALLRVLRVARGAKSLDAVRAATRDADAGVRSEAVSVLCGWPSAEALGDVLKLTKTAADRKAKILAVRGAIRLIPLQAISAAKKLAEFKELLPLIERDEEKRLLLGSLAAVPSSEALTMAMSYLDDASARSEACFAIVAISEKIVQQEPGKVINALQKVLGATKNRDVTRRARATLREARKAAGQ
ncbi:MAG: HEAT repeat domain-containing protein [Phycisphaerales bacterium]|nr:MAG: HEAT repeat domain-containing protein [Phycisphaerales bacterium]